MASIHDVPDTSSASTSEQPLPSSSSSASRSNPQTTAAPTTVPLQMTSSTGHTHEAGGVPMRHPRPLSAAELHMELEKEQEAVVNRLTRELSALRTQTASVASVASNASTSTSVSAFDAPDAPLSNSVQHPSTRNRSSSSLSARSSRSNTLSHTTALPIAQPIPSSLPNASQASVDRARDAAGLGAVSSRSRQNSTVIPGRSGQPSPSLAMHTPSAEYFTGGAYTGSTQGMASPHSLSRSSSYMSTTVSSARYEEAQHARSVLEQARSENESLIRRVKELEREIRSAGRVEMS